MKKLRSRCAMFSMYFLHDNYEGFFILVFCHECIVLPSLCPCVRVLVLFLSRCVSVKLPMTHEVSTPPQPQPNPSAVSTVLSCLGSWIATVPRTLFTYVSFPIPCLFVYFGIVLFNCLLVLFCFVLLLLPFPVIFCITIKWVHICQRE